MKHPVRILFFSVLFAGMLFSCRKNTSTPQNCNLITLSDSTTSVQAVTQFTYDNSNRITAIVVTGKYGCTRNIQYAGNTIIFTVTDTTPGIMNEIDTVVLNDAGLIQTQVSHFPSSGTSSVETYFYDSPGTAAATSSTETENGIPGDTIEYNIVNGDLIYDNVAGQTAHKDDFTYYPSEGIVFGDPTYFRQLYYSGSYYYINKHMLSVLYTAGISYKAYSYSFSNNRIAQETLRLWTPTSPDTVTHIISYSYSCK